jgi:hypothetical protein
MDEQQRNDQLLASAVTFLINGGDDKAAAILLSCTLRYEEVEHRFSRAGVKHTESTLTLTAPRFSYDFLQLIDSDYIHYEYDSDIPEELIEKVNIYRSIRSAFYAFMDGSVNYVVKANLIQISADWRKELLALLRGETVTNQGLPFSPRIPVVTWNNLRFRSQTEIRVAEALERAQVLFLPNCMARLGVSQRQNREADFLVCQKGKWGILEVDSPSSHPPTRTVEDHERDRFFKAHGIRVVEHFDASECWENADGVVKRFLYLLGQ